MLRALFYRLAIVLSLIGTAEFALADENAPEPLDAAAASERALVITDVVLQNHIDPPTRQEMVLSGIKALYRAENHPAPNGLSSRVSSLAEREQLASLLSEVLPEFSKLPNAEQILNEGMFNAIPGFTMLIAPEIDRVQEQVAANRYVGVGIMLALNEDKLPHVPKVLYNGAAWKAGMKNGDIILEVNSQPTADKKLDDVLKELRGEEGSTLTVVVRQPNSDERRTLTMTRARVFIPTIEGFREKSEGEWQYTLDTAEDIALIRVLTIGPSTVQELQQVQTRLQSQKLRGVIIDLREGGGILHNVVMVADALLDGGVIGHIRSLESRETLEARPESLFQDLPVVVLISRHSQADRVLLAAALQDQRRAIVVGEPTGPGMFVNAFLPVPGRREMLRLAIGAMERGDGTPLVGFDDQRPAQLQMPVANEGETATKRPGFVLPDHIVGGSGQPGSDLQLDKAVEVLKAMGAQASADRPDNGAENGQEKEGS